MMVSVGSGTVGGSDVDVGLRVTVAVAEVVAVDVAVDVPVGGVTVMVRVTGGVMVIGGVTVMGGVLVTGDVAVRSGVIVAGRVGVGWAGALGAAVTRAAPYRTASDKQPVSPHANSGARRPGVRRGWSIRCASSCNRPAACWRITSLAARTSAVPWLIAKACWLVTAGSNRELP
jgi:hypothetical protein